MLILLERAALNIVADEAHPGWLLVQAADAREIVAVFGDKAEVVHRPHASLPFAARLPRAQVAGVLAAHIGYIDYVRFPAAHAA